MLLNDSWMEGEMQITIAEFANADDENCIPESAWYI